MSSNYVYAIVNKVNLKLYFGSHSWEGTGLDPNYYGSGKIIKQAVKKYGKDNFIVYPIKFYNSVEECRQAEEQLLTNYSIADNPYCYNIKNGAVGWTSEDITGEKHPMYGKHFSEEHRKKLSKAMTGENNPNYGKKITPNYGKHHTSETRNKISQANGGKPFVAIKDGKVKIFASQAECSRVLGLHRPNINACLKGKQKTAGGYSFKYVEELESGIYEGIL